MTVERKEDGYEARDGRRRTSTTHDIAWMTTLAFFNPGPLHQKESIRSLKIKRKFP